MKELLELRKKKKSKKPNFTRQEITKKKKLRNNGGWRRPKGIQSKVRLGKRGHETMPSPGWGSPKEVKHLHKSGLKQILVYNLNDLDKIDPKKEGIILSKIGKKKKLDLIKKAEEKGIKILNIKDVKAFVEKVKKDREEKTKKKAEKIASKEKKKAKPKKEEKKTEEKEIKEEDKKKEDKKEKDKVLTKKS